MLRIYLLTVATGETRQLTAPPERQNFVGDLDAAFSPDGQSLAFVRMLRPPAAEVYVVRAAGGEPRRLTFDNGEVRGVTWTPDGRGIIFSSARGGAPTLWRIAAEGGEPEPLDVGGARAAYPAISRDGQRLAYETTTEATTTWAMDLPEGGGRPGPPDKLFTSTSLDNWMRYSPDGQRIAFTSNRSGTWRLWLCDADGSNPRPVPNLDYVVDLAASWSPDGRELAFASALDGSADVYVTGVDGGPPRRLTDHPEDDVAPTWSRDGRWIYFLSERTGEYQLWKVSPEGGEAVQVTREGSNSRAYESPDGRYLYYRKRAGIAGMWRMPVEGGEEELVFEKLPPENTRWDVTTEGIYYSRVEGGRKVLIEFHSFKTRRVTELASFPTLLNLTLSPDGRRLLYVTVDRWETNIVLVENARW